MASSIPAEIYDIIVDYLWDNKWALRACSLTCRAFVPSTRFHMFREVVLKGAQQYSRFSELLETPPGSSSLGIAYYVRRLTLDNTLDLRALATALAALRCLRNVECLIVESMAWDRLEFHLTAAHFPLLITLKLRNTSVEDTNTLYRFLLSHPLCKAVRLYSVSRYDWSAMPAPEVHRGDISLDELVLKEPSPLGSHTSTILSMLDAPVRLHICRLQWASTKKQMQTAGLKQLLKRVGVSLMHFSLMIYPVIDKPENGENVLRDLTLAHNLQLRSLELFCPGNKYTVRCRWVAEFLGLATPDHTHLQQINFVARGSIDNYVWSIDWVHIDESLARLARALPQLSVTFDFRKVPGCWTREEVAERILAMLPISRARDVPIAFAVTALHP